MSRRVVGLFCVLCLLTTSLSVLIGQEAKQPAKPKGRLPAYYKDVVSDKQRDQIYTIQAKYSTQLEKLAEEIKTVTAQRDKEVEGVLTAAQKTKIKELKAAKGEGKEEEEVADPKPKPVTKPAAK